AIFSPTIMAKRGPSEAQTVQSLVHDHAIANIQIEDFAANLFNASTNLVAENLWLDLKRNRLSVIIRVVVRMAGEDVRVRATEPNRGDSHQHLIGRGVRNGNSLHFQLFYATQNTRSHRCGRARAGNCLFPSVD